MPAKNSLYVLWQIDDGRAKANEQKISVNTTSGGNGDRNL